MCLAQAYNSNNSVMVMMYQSNEGVHASSARGLKPVHFRPLVSIVCLEGSESHWSKVCKQKCDPG